MRPIDMHGGDNMRLRNTVDVHGGELGTALGTNGNSGGDGGGDGKASESSNHVPSS